MLDIGDARAKSAALAAKVKEALLADGEIKTEATLDAEIGQLDTSRSLSGAELARIANRFRASHAEAVGRADARRTAEDIAEHEAEAWIANKSIHPDPVSVGYVKKLAVYAASSVIANAAQYPAPELLARKIRSKMGLLNTMLGCLGEMTRKSDLDYPRASSVARKDGSAYDLAGPCLKLDELHFRLCLANMCDPDGDIRLNVYQNAYSFPEHDLAIKSLQRKILAIPLEDAARPGAVVAFTNAFRAVYNNYTVAAGQGETTGGTQKLPRRIEEVTTQLLDDVRNIYGEGAVPQDARFFDCVPGTHFADIVRPLANAANDAHRVLKPAEVKDALRDRCRLGAAALFATRAAKTFAATHNLGDIDVSFGTTLLKRNTAIRDELLACTKPNEAEEVMARHGAEIRELAGIIAAVTAEKNRLVDRAAAKLAQATGMTVDEVKAKTDFFRLTDKAHDVEVKLIAGSYPGCREPGFSIASAFDAGLDAFVNIRITLLKKIDDEEGLSGSVKANWRDKILMNAKPNDLEADKFAKIVALRGAQIRERLETILDAGTPPADCAKAFSELAGSLGAEIVNVLGDETWSDMGPDERNAAFEMILSAVADKMPDFTDKVNAARERLLAIPEREFVPYENLGSGYNLAKILCFSLVPEE